MQLLISFQRFKNKEQTLFFDRFLTIFFRRHWNMRLKTKVRSRRSKAKTSDFSRRSCCPSSEMAFTFPQTRRNESKKLKKVWFNHRFYFENEFMNLIDSNCFLFWKWAYEFDNCFFLFWFNCNKIDLFFFFFAGISELAIKFQQNLNEDVTKVPFSKEELEGLPEDFFEGLAKQDDKFLVSLKYPELFPVLNNCSVGKNQDDHSFCIRSI